MVVGGLEPELHTDQAQALRNDNVRGDSLRLVGFDWLEHRARALLQICSTTLPTLVTVFDGIVTAHAPSKARQ